MLHGVVLELLLKFGIFPHIAGNAEDFDSLFLGGDIPTGEEAIVEGGDNLIEGISLRFITAIASHVRVWRINFRLLIFEGDRFIQPYPFQTISGKINAVE